MQLSYELHKIITFDGIEYPLSDGNDRFVLSTPGGWGMPPIEYQIRRSYKQDGVTKTGYRLNSRVFSVSFRHKGCNRDQYWSIRESLLNIMRPNRGGSMTYVIKLSTGELRAITVDSSSSPNFPEIANTTWDEYGLSELFNFEAFDPVFYDPNQDIYTLVNDPADELAFDIAFDDDGIYFGGDSYGIANITYNGSWYTYPVIRVTAPFDNLIIANITTGAQLTLMYGLSSGYVELDLSANPKTITDNLGNDLYGYLTPESNLTEFKIEPSPIASGGINQLNFFVAGYNVLATAITVRYYTRYIGI